MNPVKHLNQIELSRRWGISERTLERWRWRRTGPPFLKLGGHVAYQLSDIEAYEAAQRRHSNTHPLSPPANGRSDR
jgi:hypothetical protein